MTALIFEDYVQTWGENGWFFEFQGKIHGPWHTKTEADHSLDALMSDFYQYEDACEKCGNRLEDCECEPGFPYLLFCPISVYDPANHNPDTCPYCAEPPNNGIQPTPESGQMEQSNKSE